MTARGARAQRPLVNLRTIAEAFFGKPAGWIYERIDLFRKCGFPDPFPGTSEYDLKAVAAWCDSLSPMLRQQQTAANDSTAPICLDLDVDVLQQRLERMRNGSAA